MQSITALAWPLPSRRRFKQWNDQLRAKNRTNRENYRLKNHQKKTNDNLRACHHPTTALPARCHVQSSKGRRRHSSAKSSSSPCRTVMPGNSGYSDLNGLRGGCACTASDSEAPPLSWTPGKSWAERRRNPRVNGSDIYVARVTKSGLGSAKPCWRCLEWCRWAGVKRVFHWNGADNRFEVVKVNGSERENYETRADTRLFAGLVCVCTPWPRLSHVSTRL